MGKFTPVMAGSLRMAMEGASKAAGRRPEWFRRASDVRLLDYTSDNGDTVLVLGVPTIGEAAEELYRQQTLWDTRPAPNETAIEVMARVITEVAQEKEESNWFDASLLTRISHLQSIFTDHLSSLTLPAGRSKTAPRRPSVLDRGITAAASELSSRTPPTRQVRVAGVLDMIRHSTRTFSLKLDDGAEVRGVVARPDMMAGLPALFNRRVLVHGRAVYRPSGTLLRVDAASVEEGHSAPALFSQVPRPMARRSYRVREVAGKTGKGSVASFFGTWPGDESAADFERMLKEIRG